MAAFISPPKRIPWYLRLGLRVVRRITGRDLLPPRLLAWYPKAAVGSAVLEGLIAHDEGRVNARMLKLVRMAVSFEVGCPFCVDMNSAGWRSALTEDEVRAVQRRVALGSVASFSPAERLAVEYARLASQTPLAFPRAFIEALRGEFTEREIVILASTAAQVNYWARLIQALGCPPEGFTAGEGLFLDLPARPAPGPEPGADRPQR
jgi:alkylhydroperoxidase family enzyme